jgi:hypothetical protein
MIDALDALVAARRHANQALRTRDGTAIAQEHARLTSGQTPAPFSSRSAR